MQPIALILASTLSALNPLPLSFAPNRGQSPGPVEFEARGRNYGLFLDGQGATLSLQTSAPVCAQTASIRLKLVGATVATLQPLEALPGVVHSYVGPRSRWREGLPTYARVTHPQAWPGIDVVYYGSDGKLELDFVVQPGADLSRVAMALEGARASVDAAGTLHVAAGNGEITLPAPVLYQTIDGVREPINGRYLLRSDGNIGFAVGIHDENLPLVIDPVVVYSSYFGGSNDENVNAVAVSSAGELFIVGNTISDDFPLPTPTPGPNLNGFHGDSNGGDAFVAKISSSGQQLMYSVYLGGNNRDDAFSVALDGSGNAYVTGYTWSPDFPVLQELQTTLSGMSDAYVTMLTPTGTLAYSTYLGASGYDEAFGIAVDNTGAVYIVGDADTAFPAAGGGTLTVANSGGSFPDNIDGFIAKIGPRPANGTTPPTLVYSRLIGGSAFDKVASVALDSTKAAYLTGHTTSNDFPICMTGPCSSPSPAPMRPGAEDVFIGKVTPDGSQLAYMRLVGGGSDEEPHSIAVDSMGAAYVTGFTLSDDYPTLNAIQSAFHTGASPAEGDAFLTKLAPDGNSFVYSTFLGGTGNDIGFSLAIDPGGAAYVGGITASINFPVTSTAVEETLPNAGGSGFICRITASGSGIAWSTYFGGTGAASNVIGVGTDTMGNVFAGGFTAAQNMPTKNAAFPLKGGSNGFILKLGPSSEQPFISFITPPSAPADSNTAVTITGANFTPGSTVTFDGVTCGNIVIAANGETITCTTPRHAAGTVTVVVTNLDGRMGTKPFTFDPPSAPILSNVMPSVGPIAGGTVVTINGAKIGAAASVTFGGLAGTNISVVNSTQVTATTPAHAAGSVDVVVSNGTGLDTTLTNAFTYQVTASDAPTVTAIAPNSGPTAGGTKVAILGNHFFTGATVKIGGNNATAVTIVNDTTITATTPAGTAGAADVTVSNTNGQSGTLTGGFTYGSSSSALAVLGVVPNLGEPSGGETVTVIGANFTGDETVSFGGANATGVSKTDDNRLSVVTPAHASGSVDVVVTATDGQTATLTSGFTYRHATGGSSCGCRIGGANETPAGWLALLLIFGVWWIRSTGRRNRSRI